MKRILYSLIIAAIVVFTAGIAFGCSESVQGPAGPQGPQGEQGVQGPAGEQGSNGADGDDGKDYWEDNPQGLAFYPLDDGSFAVGIGYAKYLSAIEIPAEFHGRSVTRIAEYGFSDAKNLMSVKIPHTVTLFEDGAFMNCTKLNRLIYGDHAEAVHLFLLNGTPAFDGNIEFGKDVFENTAFMSVTVTDSSDNDTLVDCVVKNIPQEVTSVQFKAALNQSTDFVFTDMLPLDGSKEAALKVDFGTYGIFRNVSVEVYSGSDVWNDTKLTDSISVTAEEYNIGLLNGSYPVLVYSLKLNEITKQSTVPTFIALERCDAYNWSALTNGMQPMPFATRYDATENKGFHHLRPGIKSWISDLFSADSRSKFNLFVVDNYPELILEFLVANHIPEEQWNVVLLSDGAGTAHLVNSTFSEENGQAKFEEMSEDWSAVKDYVWKNGYRVEAVREIIRYGENSYFQILQRYACVIAHEQTNAQWWVNRLNVNDNLSDANLNNPALVQQIIGDSIQLNTNTLLKALDEEQKTALKELYHFSDDMFSVAQEQQKKVMVILGASAAGEGDTLYDYVRLTMDLYGDDYIYYYKGHPGHPTANVPVRQAAFLRLQEEGYSLYELDSAIAAEIILFYNPDIYMSGWSSSTFDSVEDQLMACSLFGCTIADKTMFSYGDMIDVYISRLNAGAGDYSGITLDVSRQYYLLEYNNTAQYQNQTDNYSKHEIALFDSTEGKIHYYKLSSSSVYQEVQADGSAL